MLLVSVSPYKQAGAERKRDPICRKVDGGGICRHPGNESSSGPVHDQHGVESVAHSGYREAYKIPDRGAEGFNRV